MTRKFPPSVGGMENVNYQLTDHLKQHQKIHILAWGHSQSLFFLILPWFLIRAFYALIRFREISVIMLGDGVLAPVGWMLKALFHKPVAIIIHGLDISWAFRPYQLLVVPFVKRLDQIICVSNNSKKACIERGIPSDKIAVIPNGINIPPVGDKKKALQIMQTHLGFPLEGKKIILTVGRLVRRKGVQSFIRTIFPHIIRDVKNVIYLIVGTGPQQSNIERTIKTLSLTHHVILTGKVSPSILDAAYQTADIFVMPNIPVVGDLEGFGIVALEAGAFGIPVVASNIDGIPQAVHHGQNGILVEHDDITNFVNTIKRLLSNDVERIQAGQKAREYIKENFSWEKITQDYLTILQNMGLKKSPR